MIWSRTSNSAPGAAALPPRAMDYPSCVATPRRRACGFAGATPRAACVLTTAQQCGSSPGLRWLAASCSGVTLSLGHTAARILGRAGISMIKMSIRNFSGFVGYFEELFRGHNYRKRARYWFVPVVPCCGTAAGFRRDRQSPHAAGAAESDLLRAAHREIAAGVWTPGKAALFRRRTSGVRDKQRPAGQPRRNDAASRGADADAV